MKLKIKVIDFVTNDHKLTSTYNKALNDVVDSISRVEKIQYYYLGLISRNCGTALTGIYNIYMILILN